MNEVTRHTINIYVLGQSHGSKQESTAPNKKVSARISKVNDIIHPQIYYGVTCGGLSNFYSHNCQPTCHHRTYRTELPASFQKKVTLVTAAKSTVPWHLKPTCNPARCHKSHSCHIYQSISILPHFLHTHRLPFIYNL